MYGENLGGLKFNVAHVCGGLDEQIVRVVGYGIFLFNHSIAFICFVNMHKVYVYIEVNIVYYFVSYRTDTYIIVCRSRSYLFIKNVLCFLHLLSYVVEIILTN